MTTDLVILSLPWFVFRNLNLSRRKQYELLMICSVGVFTLITSVVRLPYLHHLNQSTDPTWDVVNISTWSIAELGTAITLSSIPAIRPLFGHYFPNFMGSLMGKSSRDPQGSNQTPPFGASSRGKKTSELSTTETMAANWLKNKQDWHQYIELDDRDEVRRKRSEDMQSQQHILPPGVQNPARVR